jgi:ferredoxin-NADP reductase/phenylpropionate dioxygenase-like ring-hydroxylating dioxygenase large terminal subunit
MSQIADNPAQLRTALDRGESLPAHWYTDPSITAAEIAQIFRKAWNYIGPLCRLKNLGDYITGYAGEVPVVVIRNEAGLAGFVNVCRHRRHEVMKGHGNARVMQCGYHAWTYDLSGLLKGAPRSAGEPNFRLENFPLLPIRAEALGPFVFANLDREAAPVAAYYGPVLDIIRGSGVDLDTLELYEREEWQSHSNWKTMLENYLECYHCAVAHPSFSAAIDVRQENYNLTAHGWFSSQLGQVRPSALEGRSQVKIYDVTGEVAESQYHLLFPNMTININPGFPNLSIDVWMADGPNATKGFSEQYFAPGVTEEFAGDLIAFNKEVGAEDDVLTDSVQRGLLGGLPERGRFLTNSEHLVVHFQKLIVDAVTGGEAALLPAAAAAAPALSRTIPLLPDASAVPDSERNAYFELEVARVEPESEIIRSFYLRRTDGKPLEPWIAGQFLPIRVAVPGQSQPVLRTFTLSTTPNPDHYRLSIRRGGEHSLVSRHLHENGKPGLRIEAMTPRGKFVLTPGERPVVFVSGGVGITPMIAMANQIVEDGRRTGKFRPVWFVHGTNNGRVHAFAKHVRELAATHPAMRVHVRYSQPGSDDRLGATHDGEGHVTIDVLKQLLPFDDYDFYLCGPPPFMQSLYDGLSAIGVRRERIHYESFGAGTALKPEAKPDAPLRAGQVVDGAVPVRFAKSSMTAEWSRNRGTLLELAESVGLAPVFGCRSGICGTCATRITSGAVDYVEEPLAPRGEGQVLLCCSVPAATAAVPGGANPGIVLDL